MRVRASARVVIAVGSVAAGVAFAGAPPVEHDARALARALGQLSRGAVQPEDIRWEPSSGVVADAVMGRWVLFLASAEPGGPRDVWRARVRLAPEGTPLSIADAHNLTTTPLGDDHALVVRGRHAAFATFAYGQEQSVSVLDLAGEGGQNKAEKLVDRLAAAVTNVQQTGSVEGIARSDVTLEQPAKAVGLVLGDAELAIELLDESGVRKATFDLEKSDLTAPVAGLRAEAQRHLPKRLVHWAVDTVRAVSWIGPAPIAWLEERAFAARDTMKQVAFKFHGADSTGTLSGTPEPEPPPLDASKLDDGGRWPPSALKSMWKTGEPGEGEWQVPKIPWLRRMPGADDSVPPAFLRTFVRPDEERPYAKVLLVAMDMRQLDLDMEAGTEDPRPLTGAPGPGRIPRDPAVFTRVAAAFNGGFKTEHGNYGMMVRRRVLLPPQPGVATVVLTKDQRVGMGSWPNTHDVKGIAGIAGDDIVSFRQNLDPLVDQGQVNPAKRSLWGFTLPGTGMQTERSGICVTQTGNMLYAWGDDVSATTLGKAMKMAGCIYGMHLDMNPHHTGFVFASIDEFKGKKYKAELLSNQMEISPERYLEYAQKDFFYITVRDPLPKATGSVQWAADAGAQPPPAFLPSILRGKIEGDAVTEVVSVDVTRASFRVRGGTHEPDAKTGGLPARELSEADAHRVLFSVGLGFAAEKHLRGLVTDGRQVLPWGHGGEQPWGVLTVSPDGALAIVDAAHASDVAPHADAVELPMLLKEGEPTHAVRVAGDGAPMALGIAANGKVYVARGSSPASLGEALKRVGCANAVLLERGGAASGFLHRAGTSTPPRARYEESVLYGLSLPMKARALRFDAEPEFVVPPPKGK